MPELAEIYAEFESLLDAQLALISPEWQIGDLPDMADRPDYARHRRCTIKRGRLAKALTQAPHEVRNHRDALFHLVAHDPHASFNQYLIMPIVAAIGRHELHEALIGYLETGTYVERLCSLKAWYQAQPGLFYDFSDAFERGEANPDRMAAYDAWVALRPRFLAACRIAVEGCETPEERERIADLARSVARAEIVTIGDPGPPNRL
ncbi:hypothetical protein ABH926_004224 [Catenulispora sp. GP43]|uniref:hypothetical protein n=1 Tax=Catenulispora sp. GP43 TaxID=3156263 RepID=UPI00351524D3